MNYRNTAYDHHASRKGRGRGGWWIFLLVLIGLIAGAAATCPDKEKHVAVLSDKMGYALMGESGSNASGLEALGGLLGKGIANLALNSLLVVEDYFVVSVGKLDDLDGNSQVVSIGIFGHVLTASREQMRKRVRENLEL